MNLALPAIPFAFERCLPSVASHTAALLMDTAITTDAIKLPEVTPEAFITYHALLTSAWPIATAAARRRNMMSSHTRRSTVGAARTAPSNKLVRLPPVEATTLKVARLIAYDAVEVSVVVPDCVVTHRASLVVEIAFSRRPLALTI